MSDDERAEELLRGADWVSGNPALWASTSGDMRGTLRSMIIDAFYAVRADERERCARVLDADADKARKYLAMVGGGHGCESEIALAESWAASFRKGETP